MTEWDWYWIWLMVHGSAQGLYTLLFLINNIAGAACDVDWNTGRKKARADAHEAESCRRFNNVMGVVSTIISVFLFCWYFVGARMFFAFGNLSDSCEIGCSPPSKSLEKFAGNRSTYPVCPTEELNFPYSAKDAAKDCEEFACYKLYVTGQRFMSILFALAILMLALTLMIYLTTCCLRNCKCATEVQTIAPSRTVGVDDNGDGVIDRQVRKPGQAMVTYADGTTKVRNT